MLERIVFPIRYLSTMILKCEGGLLDDSFSGFDGWKIHKD
jgi:hypothetical protein